MDSALAQLRFVLKANPGLAEYELLPAGLTIKLPVIQKAIQKQVVKLWN